jgi:hypothetical protein
MAIYLLGAALTALGVYAGRRFSPDDRDPAPQNLASVAVLAGLVWPVVLIGAVQFGALFALRRFARWMFPAESRDHADVSERQIGMSDEYDASAAWDRSAQEELYVRMS